MALPYRTTGSLSPAHQPSSLGDCGEKDGATLLSNYENRRKIQPSSDYRILQSASPATHDVIQQEHSRNGVSVMETVVYTHDQLLNERLAGLTLLKHVTQLPCPRWVFSQEIGDPLRNSDDVA